MIDWKVGKREEDARRFVGANEDDSAFRRGGRWAYNRL